MTQPAYLFISDLHLSASSRLQCSQFVQLLNQAKLTAKAVYILGDLFDYWIGDDNNAPYLTPIEQALKDLAQAIPCYFIAGNRDFLVGKNFFDRTKIIPLNDPQKIILAEQQVLLLHGDLLCTDDESYQAYRRKVRQPQVMTRFLKLPLFLRKLIARATRWLSQRKQKKAPLSTLQANQQAILALMAEKQTDTLIFGHVHQPGIHFHQTPGATMQRWLVLGDWTNTHYSTLWLYEDGRFQLNYDTYPS